MEDRYELGSVHEINVIEMAPDQVPQMFWKVGWWRTCCSYNILRSYWELSRAPPQWIGMLRRIHEIWVPNEFVRRAFEEVFTGPINVVPPCIEVEVNDRFERQYFNLDKNRFYFMLSFDYYSHPSRKNPLGVMRSFNMAFPNPAEEVGLVIKSTGAADNWPGIKLAIMEAAHHDQRIKIMDETFSRDEMLSLIANSDCYVSLHRAEGFGLGMAEAMALGKPVIGTDYSGSTDFLSETTAFPVSCTLRPLSPGEYIFSEGQGWVDPDEVAAAEAMRDVHSDQQERQERAANGRAFVEDRYDRNSVGRIAARRLQDILAARISRGSVPPPSLRPKSLARTGTRENASVYHKERT
jgi:glycosyltransferase involved in cell wall biosynthesis